MGKLTYQKMRDEVYKDFDREMENIRKNGFDTTRYSLWLGGLNMANNLGIISNEEFFDMRHKVDEEVLGGKCSVAGKECTGEKVVETQATEPESKSEVLEENYGVHRKSKVR